MQHTCEFDEALEARIAELGLNAPRVTLAALKENIKTVEIVRHVTVSGKVLRWAVLTTANGFAVTGKPSAAVSPENDNKEIGEKVAIDNATAELWALMGYALAEVQRLRSLASGDDPAVSEGTSMVAGTSTGVETLDVAPPYQDTTALGVAEGCGGCLEPQCAKTSPDTPGYEPSGSSDTGSCSSGD